MATDSNTEALAVPRTTDSSFRAATTARWADLVTILVDVLGVSLVALIAGVDPATVTRWAKGAARTPRTDAERRLRTAYRIVDNLSTVESRHTVRAWFMGANPYLGETSPAEALRDDRDKVVLAAADAFRHGG